MLCRLFSQPQPISPFSPHPIHTCPCPLRLSPPVPHPHHCPSFQNHLPPVFGPSYPQFQTRPTQILRGTYTPRHTQVSPRPFQHLAKYPCQKCPPTPSQTSFRISFDTSFCMALTPSFVAHLPPVLGGTYPSFLNHSPSPFSVLISVFDQFFKHVLDKLLRNMFCATT